MKPEIKAMNDLFDSLSRLALYNPRAIELSKALSRALPGFPRSVIEILTGIADKKLTEDPTRGPLIVATYVGVLLQSYDETPLTIAEWRELRDLVADCADELDMDVVAYAMSLVVEYGAL